MAVLYSYYLFLPQTCRLVKLSFPNSFFASVMRRGCFKNPFSKSSRDWRDSMRPGRLKRLEIRTLTRSFIDRELKRLSKFQAVASLLISSMRREWRGRGLYRPAFTENRIGENVSPEVYSCGWLMRVPAICAPLLLVLFIRLRAPRASGFPVEP